MSLARAQLSVEDDHYNSETKLVDEFFAFYIPTLGAIYGERAGVFIQKVFLLLKEPHWRDYTFETTTYQGRRWVRIPDWLIYDEIEGMMPGVGSEDSSYKMRTSLVKEGVLMQTNKLNVERSDKTNWFTVNLQNHTTKVRDFVARTNPIRQLRSEEKEVLARVQKGRKRQVDFKPGIIETLIDDLQPQELETLNDLRKAAGLPPMRQQPATIHSLEEATPQNGGSHPSKDGSPQRPRKSADTDPANRRIQTPQIDESQTADLRASLSIQEDLKNQTEAATTTRSNFFAQTEAFSVLNVAAAVEASPKNHLPPSAESPTKTASPSNEEEARLLQLESQLLEFADIRDISLSEEQAHALVESWPAARLDADGLYRALTDSTQCGKFGLDAPVEPNSRGDLARKMVGEEEGRLRWALCVWHGFPESTGAYHEKKGNKYTKTQCFLSKFKAKANPPAQWLERELAAFKAQEEVATRLVHKAQAQERQREFEELRATLNPAQLAHLKTLLHERMEHERPGGSKATWDTKAVRAWEAEILFDPARRDEVLRATFEDESVQSGDVVSQCDDGAAQIELDVCPAPRLSDLNAGVVPTSAVQQARQPPDERARPQLLRYVESLIAHWMNGASSDELDAKAAHLVAAIPDREWVVAQVVERMQVIVEQQREAA